MLQKMAAVVTPILKLQPSNTMIEDDFEKKHYWSTLLDFWKLPPNISHFPGPNPISLERTNIEDLNRNDYLVALKTDGVRYLLLMTTKPNSTEPISLMIDRVKVMYEVEIWASEEFFYNGCLLDGELVWNSNGDLQFIIFDVVVLKGMNCIDMSYRERLDVINNHILCMDDALDDDVVEKILSEEDKFCARNNSYNLQILPKMCVSKFQIAELWKSSKLTCCHKNDGVIFTLNNAPVHTGTSKYIYKWKPLHSIDVKCLYDRTWSFFVNANDSDMDIDITETIDTYETSMDLTSNLLQLLERKVECVVECVMNIVGNKIILIPERERSDKKAANTMNTVLKTIKNTQENIQVNELYKITTGIDATDMDVGP